MSRRGKSGTIGRLLPQTPLPDSGIFSLSEIYNSTLAPIGGKVVFTFTGADQTWNIPIGVTTLAVKIWGAGGGGSGGTTTGRGGAGGYVEGVISVSGISTLSIVVGEGGKWSANEVYYAGGGGGYSGIFNGAVSHENSLVIAGGGGGSADGGGSQGAGGGGGGETGGAGQDDTRLGSRTGGLGGSQIAGGAKGIGAFGAAVLEDGAALYGGDGAGCTAPGSGTQGANYWETKSYGGGGRGGLAPSGNWVGGGGGGGYYGGGGGHEGYAGGGGGGSSYVGGLTTVINNLQGVSGINTDTGEALPPNTAGNGDYIFGVGTTSNVASGGHGLVVIEYS